MYILYIDSIAIRGDLGSRCMIPMKQCQRIGGCGKSPATGPFVYSRGWNTDLEAYEPKKEHLPLNSSKMYSKISNFKIF